MKVAPVAFRAASGDLSGSPSGTRPRLRIRPTSCTRGPLGDQTTSIEASFDFSVQRSLKYPHVRPQMGNFATASRRESDSFPPTRSQGAQRNPLGPRSRNRPRPSGWELESQIRGHPPSEGSGQGACRAASLSRLQLTRKWPVSYPG